MIQKLTILLFFIIFGSFGFAHNDASANAAATLQGLQQTANKGYGKPLAKTQNDLGVSGMAGKALGAILAFTGIIFFALMIYGGILWMTAAGNDEQTKKAMNVITAAIVGVVIVASAYAITAYIGGVLTK